MRKVIHSIPEGPYDCELVGIETQVIPIVNFALKLVLNPTYYASEADWLRGEQLIRRFQVALLCGGLQELKEGNDRLYRLINATFNSETYTVVDGVITPPIPEVPYTPGYEPNHYLANIAFYIQGMMTTLGQLNSTLSGMTSPVSGNTAPYFFGNGVTLQDILDALVTGNGQLPGDYASVLDQIAFNTGLTRTNAGVTGRQVAQQVCCDIATVEPLPTTNTRPADEVMCAGLQVIAGGIGDALNTLYQYLTRNQDINATNIALLVNRDFNARTLPSISSATASELFIKLGDLTGGGNPFNTWYGNVQKQTLITAVYGASDADTARSLYEQWAETLEFTPYEIQQLLKVLGRDQSLWNALMDGTIDTTGYDGTICSGTPPVEPAVISSVFGAQFDNVTEAIEVGTHHYYAENASGATYYQADYSWNIVSGIDTHALNRTGEVDDVRGNALFGYFPNDWVGVQLKIQDGPDDVALHFPAPAEHADIALSKTAWTTLPAGAAGFTIYAASDDHVPYTPFTLLAIFP